MFSLPYKEIEQRTPMYSGNIGIISKPSDNTKVSFMVSTGYRVPNIDDMSKIFGSSKDIVIVPNTGIRSEKTVNYELGITTIMNSKTKWETSLFYTDFYDITVVDKFQLNGKDSLMYDGTMSRVYANQNKGRAYIYGLSTNLTSALNKNFSVHMMMSYQYGRVKTDSTDYPLDHISPFYSRLSLRYKNKMFSSDFYIVHNGWKRINDYYLNGEDNEQYATPQGIPAWFTLNIRASYTINKYFQVDAGIDNILDTQYRAFASGINAPGRNMIVALRANF
jgi:hemoglobin/transferrin/lactoferrin receptor protein